MTAWVLVLILQSGHAGGLTSIDADTQEKCMSMGEKYVEAMGGTGWKGTGQYMCLNRSNK